MAPGYVGRFAPSPTGPLHFGSLLAAVASYADARHNQGQWLVRIEDVDETRRRDHAADAILRSLRSFGMHWDREPVYQTQRTSLYDGAIGRLAAGHDLYRCNCSRSAWRGTARIGREGPVYPGNCRHQPPPADVPAALRMLVGGQTLSFKDRVYGDLSQNLAEDVGDFILRRIDGYTAYQLAVVVDDAEQHVTDVVRGADLLWSTPRQIWIQRRLGLPTPRYAHIPLARDAAGRKLSKRDSADPVDDSSPMPALLQAWKTLGQQEPPFRCPSPTRFWEWAVPNWRIEQVPPDNESASDA